MPLLNLQNLGLEHRNQFIFFASNKTIVYRQDANIEKASCDGEVLTRFPCPLDYRHYELVERPEELIFVLGGRTIARIGNKNDVAFHDLNVSLFGIAKTEICDSQGSLIFGTRSSNRLQFVGYDVDEQKRRFQTSSWTMSSIDAVKSNGPVFYGLFDRVIIGCWDSSTGEQKFTKMETDTIDKSILPYKNGLLYVTQNCLRYLVNGKTTTIKIPLVRPSKLLGVENDNIYLLGNGTNIYCYNMITERLVWNVANSKPIDKWLITQGRGQSTVSVIMLVAPEDILLIDATNGHFLYSIPCVDVYRIRQTADHILLHKNNNTTDLIPSL
jgi:hypothetical protein